MKYDDSKPSKAVRIFEMIAAACFILPTIIKINDLIHSSNYTAKLYGPPELILSAAAFLCLTAGILISKKPLLISGSVIGIASSAAASIYFMSTNHGSWIRTSLWRAFIPNGALTAAYFVLLALAVLRPGRSSLTKGAAAAVIFILSGIVFSPIMSRIFPDVYVYYAMGACGAALEGIASMKRWKEDVPFTPLNPDEDPRIPLS